jgi:hypothetical protein
MVHGVERKPIGPMETLEFRQDMAGAKHPWRFPAQNMSDGTLRALGVLTALFQGNRDYAPSLVGIEEPETALHPAASAALREALARASQDTQVIVTSHSPDLLDDLSLSADALLAVVSEGGETRIAPLDEAARMAMRDQLFSAGELLRLNQLAPDRAGACGPGTGTGRSVWRGRAVIAVAAIVEGAGEVAALPILLRRINAWRTPDVHLQALPPIRVHRDRFLNRDDEFRRHLLLAAAKCGEKVGFSCCSTPMMTVRLSWGNRFSSEQLHTFRTVGCRSYWPTGNTRPGSSPRLNRSMANAVSHSSLLKRLMPKVRAMPRGGSRRTCAAAVTGKRPTSRLFRLAWTCSRPSHAAGLFASFAASGQGRWPSHEQGAMSRRREIAKRLDALSDIGGILSAMKDLPTILAPGEPARNPLVGSRMFDLKPLLLRLPYTARTMAP